MSGKERISKQKGVDECVKMMYSGKTRKDIVPKFTKDYGVSVSCVEKWMRAAQPKVDKLRKADEETTARVQSEQTEEVAKRLGISREWLLAKWKQIADADIRNLYDENGTMKNVAKLDDDTAATICGIETVEMRDPVSKKVIGTTVKVKREQRTTALSEIGKLQGYYPQTTATVKVDEKDKAGETKKVTTVTLNLT